MSDDDWFEKDIEEIVADVKEKKKTNDEELAILSAPQKSLHFNHTNDSGKNCI